MTEEREQEIRYKIVDLWITHKYEELEQFVIEVEEERANDN